MSETNMTPVSAVAEAGTGSKELSLLPPDISDAAVVSALAVRPVSAARARLLWEALDRGGEIRLSGEDDRYCAFRDLVFVVEAMHQSEAEGSVCVSPKRFNSVARGRSSLTSACISLERIGLLCRSDADGLTSGRKLFIGEFSSDRLKVVRLYCARSFFEELALAKAVAGLTKDVRALPAPNASVPQRVRAVESASINAFSVISGGPGTGKTTLVTEILKKILKTKPHSRIVLAAPTGKAAGRMQEAVRKSVAEKLEDSSDGAFAALLTVQAQTVHRLLSSVGGDGTLPGPDAPLDADVLVIDESSMIDARLAMRLFRAIDVRRTKVILLGDRFQLAAVGPGSVFSDLSDEAGVLKPFVTRLTRSYRFEDGKAVATLAAAVNDGRTDADFETIANTGERTDDNIIRWHKETPIAGERLTPALIMTIRGMVARLKTAISNHATSDRESLAAAAARCWADFGILCAQRHGTMSAEAVNAYADDLMKGDFEGRLWRPVIVRRNDPVIGVSNGDVGIIVPGEDNEGEDLYLPDGSGKGRFIRLALIECFELAFAITIHQSQGSEYLHVAVVLPVKADSSLASRELLYTAITRVKDQFKDDVKIFGTLDLFGSEAVLKSCVGMSAEREGGLSARLAQLKVCQ